VPVQGSYWLIWPEEKKNLAPIVAFRTWLAAEAALAP
jgi:LysR family transcriptional regulator, glycine cleavage system transcriptional activator